MVQESRELFDCTFFFVDYVKLLNVERKSEDIEGNGDNENGNENEVNEKDVSEDVNMNMNVNVNVKSVNDDEHDSERWYEDFDVRSENEFMLMWWKLRYFILCARLRHYGEMQV